MTAQPTNIPFAQQTPPKGRLMLLQLAGKLDLSVAHRGPMKFRVDGLSLEDVVLFAGVVRSANGTTQSVKHSADTGHYYVMCDVEGMRR